MSNSKTVVKAKPAQNIERMQQNLLKEFELFVNDSSLMRRGDIMRRMGMDFNGKRDYDETFGWTRNPTYDQLLAMYESDGMAGAIGDAYADETWRLSPIIHDGDEADTGDDEDNKSVFLQAWEELSERLSIISVFSDIDAACSYSRYAVMFLGYPGQFSQPYTGSKGQLAYVSVFDEKQATIEEYDTDTKSPRFGLPTKYRIKFADSDKGMGRLVHWTRIIHVIPYGHSRSKVFGKPLLKRVLNYLEDLRKVLGSSSEAFWLLIYRGLLLSTKEGYKMPKEGTPAYTKIQEQLEEFERGMRRTMNLDGMEAQDLGGTPVDGFTQVKTLVAILSGILRMPQRILIGSERGELSSTSDDKNWADVINSRQTKYSERYYVRQFIDAMILHGTLPPPSSGKYTCEWQSLFSLTDVEKSEVAKNYGEAASKFGDGVAADVIPAKIAGERFFDYKAKPEDMDNPIETEKPVSGDDTNANDEALSDSQSE